ncbi:MAG: TlpA family protein disulfide reductase [Thermodesulfovibrionales bacterium]|nr:TlpA family protein disulfide reductase [Thermodesulfovibrionales bacterium]
MRWKGFLLLLIFFVFLSCKRAVIQEGKALPDLSFKNINGELIRLHDLKGKVLIIEFWATWCEACREAVPDLIEIYKSNRDKGFELISVSIDEGGDYIKRIKDFIDEYKIPYPVAVDGITLSRKFGVYTIPSIFIVNRDGILVKRFPGYFPDFANRIDNEIKRLL